MEWTPEQKKIIALRGNHVLVSAAAGSGKTAVLVERIRRLIIEDRTPLDAMLVVTFTEAAASEMRQKITEAVTGALDEGDDPFLREQVRKIYGAHISTFHAFALTILRKYFYMTGMEPVMNVCDDFRREFLMSEALDRLFEESFEQKDPAFLDFLKKYAGPKNENGVRDMILETWTFINSMPDPFGWLDTWVDRLQPRSPSAGDSANGTGDFAILDRHIVAYLRAEIQRDLQLAIEDLEHLGELLQEEGVPSLAAKNQVDLEALLEIEETLENSGFESIRARLVDFNFIRFVAKKDDKENYGQIRGLSELRRGRAKKRITRLKELFFTKSLEEMAAEVEDTAVSAQMLRDLTRRFHDLFSEAKRKEGLIDFNDIEHFSLKILEDERVQQEYRNKFQYIFIDEYQDSNYIQEALIERVGRPDNLFMVGDVKQSIYKFRLAEPEIFIEKYNRFSRAKGEEDADGIAIDLNRNFRSKETILAEVNRIFTYLMDARLSGIVYDEKAMLRRGIVYDVALDKPVELVLIDAGDPALASMKDAEREALAAARILMDAHGEPFYDAKAGCMRPLEYRDMVVLLRETRTSAPVWCDVLLSQGIPAYTDSGDGYLDAIEIETFVSLLRVIDNPRQDIPLASVMYAPIFGFTTEELLRIRTAAEGPFYAAVIAFQRENVEIISISGKGDKTETGMDPGTDPQILTLAKKVERMTLSLDRWRQDRQFMELPEFLWMLLKESGYYDYAGALMGGEQRKANLRALVEKAAAFQRERIRGLFDFIRHMDAIREKRLPMGQVKLLSENDDVVRITTIHRSKGLEYPMVVVGQTGKRLGGPGSRGKVQFHKDLGVAIQWEDQENHTWRRTLLQKLIARRKAAEERAEDIRVLYVALTRAMDRLILIGISGNPDEFLAESGQMEASVDTDVMASGSWLAMLQPLLGEGGIRVSVDRLEGPVAEMPSGGETHSRKAWPPSDLITEEGGANAEEVHRRLSWEYPFKGALKMKSKYSVSELARRMADGESGAGIVGQAPGYGIQTSRVAGQTFESVGQLSGVAGKTVELVGQYAEFAGQKNEWLGQVSGEAEYTVESVGQVSGIAEQRPESIRKMQSRTGDQEDPLLHYFLAGSPDEMAEDAGMLMEPGELTAAERGTALHKALERLDYREAFARREDPAHFIDYLDQLAARGILTGEERSAISPSALLRYANTALFARAAASGRLRKEAPFNLRRKWAGEDIIVQGVIDCFFEEEGRIVLIDFKTTFLSEGDKAGATRILTRYGPQINLYREALEAVTGLPVDEAWLYLTGSGVFLPVPR